MVSGKALDIVRELSELSSGKMRAGCPDYCQGYNDGMVTLARELLLLADTPPDERKNFRRRHYILWSDELFPTISCLTQTRDVTKPGFERIITSSEVSDEVSNGEIYFCSSFHSTAV